MEVRELPARAHISKPLREAPVIVSDDRGSRGFQGRSSCCGLLHIYSPKIRCKSSVVRRHDVFSPKVIFFLARTPARLAYLVIDSDPPSSSNVTSGCVSVDRSTWATLSTYNTPTRLDGHSRISRPRYTDAIQRRILQRTRDEHAIPGKTISNYSCLNTAEVVLAIAWVPA